MKLGVVAAAFGSRLTRAVKASAEIYYVIEMWAEHKKRSIFDRKVVQILVHCCAQGRQEVKMAVWVLPCAALRCDMREAEGCGGRQRSASDA